MTHAYSEMYLEDAMRTLGEAVDFALCDQGLTPAELTAILSNALEMKQFERGMPRVVCGMAGDELARDIIAHAGLTPVKCRETYPFDRSPQYWAGWVMAYTQWMSSLGFNKLLEVAPLDWIIGSYHPLHEASEDKFAQIVIEKWNNAQADKKGLKAARKAAGLTQKQLAAQSGVKLRAIQLYEQNQLDLRRKLHHRRPRLATDCSGVRLAGYFACKAIEESDMPWSYVQQDDGADCVAQEDHSTAHVANSASPILLGGATSIDEAIRLTISNMPNALRLLENS